jgi:cytochrome c553
MTNPQRDKHHKHDNILGCKLQSEIVMRRERWLVVVRRTARLGLGWGAAFGFALMLLACFHVNHAAANDDSVARGRRLFETGIGRNGQAIEAAFADSATPVPGTLLSCAGCHGRDGTGRPVKGVDPPNITWQNLTKPYALQARAGRSRLPYTEALLLRAVVTGIDSSNQLLGPAMPHFRLTPGDGADLVAYMRELGAAADPGITAQAITIGVVLPPREPTAELHDAVRAALESYGDELNRAGGVFGRHIAFAFVGNTAVAGPSQTAAGQPLERNILAAVVSDAIDPAALVSRDVPLVAVRADGVPLRPNVFYLSAGLLGELGALAAQVARELGDNARLTILHTDDDAGRERLATLRGLLARNAGPAIDAVPLVSRSDAIADETIRRIQASDAILFAGWDRRFSGLLSRLEPSNRLMLVPGSLIDALPDAPTRMLIAYETGAPSAQRETRPEAARRTVLAATRLLVEGLRRAGRDVSRAKLVDAIETIQRFEIGYGAPVSYSLQQHVGFIGAQIMRFDPHQLRSMQPVVNVELD